MAGFVALYDACVLYPAPLRDLLLWLARTNLFRACWTDRIHEEWTRSVLENRPDLREKLQRTRTKMDDAVPDCLVTGYEGFIDQLSLPDPDDRHVLAAAIRCQAGVIVTLNLKDFPSSALESYGIEAQHPDDFIHCLYDLSPMAVWTAVHQQRIALKKPPKSISEQLKTFLSLGLARTVTLLEDMQELL